MKGLAEEQGPILDREPARLPCPETSRKYTAAPGEVRSLIEDPNTGPSEVAALFTNAKWMLPRATDANSKTTAAAGYLMWAPAYGNLMNVTVGGFRTSGMRLLFEGSGMD